MKIEDAIEQYKFEDPHHKAQLNILFSSTWLKHLTDQTVKPYKVSWQQFNVLRILRGMDPEPATVKLLTQKMIDKSSNASRLVDKLLQKGYVKRTTCNEDRRRVNIVLTELGQKVVNEASVKLSDVMKKHTSSITVEEAIELSRILDKMRENSPKEKT